MARRFVREQLREGHRVSAFRCGNADLDRWLVESATSAAIRDYSRTYVWVGASGGSTAAGSDSTAGRGDLGEVVAYFTLSAFAITRGTLPRRMSRSEYRVIPALLLGKLALDISLQGRGYGRILLADAVVEAVRASRLAAARYLVVDAINPRAAEFYGQFGFVSIVPAGSTGAWAGAELGAGVESGAAGLAGDGSDVGATSPLRMAARMRDLETALS